MLTDGFPRLLGNVKRVQFSLKNEKGFPGPFSRSTWDHFTRENEMEIFEIVTLKQ